MVRTAFVTTLICIPLLTACAKPYSEVPVAANFPATLQPKLQAAAHWNVIAEDVAKQISARLKEKPPLYVNQSSVITAFDRAFSNQLISALVADGFVVLRKPESTMTVQIDIQAVRFSAHRPQYRYPGTATVVAIGATPQMEIIITISVDNARLHAVRSTNIYYVTDTDSHLYVPPPPRQVQTRNIEVTGP